MSSWHHQNPLRLSIADLGAGKRSVRASRPKTSHGLRSQAVGICVLCHWKEGLEIPCRFCKLILFLEKPVVC